MKKILAILLSTLLIVAAFAISTAAVTWEDGQTREELEDGTKTNYVFDNAYSYVFRIDNVNGTIAGEDNTIITSEEEYNASNPNWAISVLLAPTSEANVYEVAHAPVVTPGDAAKGLAAGINFENGNIVLICHSSGSLPADIKDPNKTFPNWEQKVAAVALKVGDKITLAGVDLVAGTATDATATVQDAPEGYEVTNGKEEESEGGESEGTESEGTESEGGDESEGDESTPEVPAVESTNIALGATYTTTPLFGQDEYYHYDPEADPSYPDEEGVTLTDGIFPADGAAFSDVEWVGFNSNYPEYEGLGAHNITVDLGESTDLAKFVFWYGTKALSNGIGAPTGVEVYVSEDGETWGEAVGSATPANDEAVVNENVTIEAEATGRYVQFRFTSGGWAFISEVEVYNKGTEGSNTPDVSVPDESEGTESEGGESEGNESEEPIVPGDASNMIVFAIIALVAIAGSAVVIKTRK